MERLTIVLHLWVACEGLRTPLTIPVTSGRVASHFYDQNNFDLTLRIIAEAGNSDIFFLPVMPAETIHIVAFEPVREKTNNLGSDQVRYKPGCTVTEDV